VVKEINMPRLPSIKSMKNARKSEIEVLTFDDMKADENRTGLKGSPTQVRKIFVPFHETCNEMIEGTLEEKTIKLAEILMKLKGKVK